MTRTEHLLTILAEECSEVAQRVSKALRFGLDEIQPGQPHTNAERINAEMIDLMATLEMLNDEGALPKLCSGLFPYLQQTAAKKKKVEKYLAFSAGRGLVDGTPADPNIVHPELKTVTPGG